MKNFEKPLRKFEHFDNIPSNLFKETVNIILEKHAPTKENMCELTKRPLLLKN